MSGAGCSLYRDCSQSRQPPVADRSHGCVCPTPPSPPVAPGNRGYRKGVSEGVYVSYLVPSFKDSIAATILTTATNTTTTSTTTTLLLLLLLICTATNNIIIYYYYYYHSLLLLLLLQSTTATIYIITTAATTTYYTTEYVLTTTITSTTYLNLVKLLRLGDHLKHFILCHHSCKHLIHNLEW